MRSSAAIVASRSVSLGSAVSEIQYQLLCAMLHECDFMSTSEAALWLQTSESRADDLLHRYWREHPDAAARERVRRRDRMQDFVRYQHGVK